MNSTQKFIKYMAIIFAGCLIIGIVSVALHVVVGIVGEFIPDKKQEVTITEDEKEDEETIDSEEVYEDVENLQIASGLYKICILEDSSIRKGVKVSLSKISSDCNVTYKKAAKTVEISDKASIFSFLDDRNTRIKGTIDIYVSPKIDLKEVDIQVGVGNVSIEDIKIDLLDIESGVGTFSCDDVEADTVNIKGGVGNVSFEDVNFKGICIEGGVGDVDICGKLTGKIEISAGMGDIELEIDGDKNDYSCNIETGLGSIFVDGEKCGDINFGNDNENNFIDIEGGIGTIKLDFK